MPSRIGEDANFLSFSYYVQYLGSLTKCKRVKARRNMQSRMNITNYSSNLNLPPRDPHIVPPEEV
jgi:hypothetical protein